MHNVNALKQINICTLPPFKKKPKTSLVFETIIHEKNTFVYCGNASQTHADYLRMVSAPCKKFATYYECCNKHKTQVRIYSIPLRLYHVWRLLNSFTSSACCLNEYLTCNDSFMLTSLLEFFLNFDRFFE